MTEAEWLTSDDPRPMFFAFSGRYSRRKVLLFAVAACAVCRTRFADDRCWAAVEVVERFADGVIQTADVALLTWKVDAARRAAYNTTTSSPGRRRMEQCSAQAACALVESVGDVESRAVVARAIDAAEYARQGVKGGRTTQTRVLRDIFGNPFRPVTFSPEWHTDTAVALAGQMYESRDFGTMPILADAIQDAGCDSDDILNHCRSGGPHVRGCWVLDLVLGKK